MDASTAVAVAIISAISGLISGVVVAYAKPLAEDRARALREKREMRQRHLELMWDALLDPRNARRVLPVLASALDDEQLARDVGRLLAAEADDEQQALGNARRRLGQLMRS
ncbi:MAG TPA: hypothetical protein VMP67_01615 [Candidatus Limnocylindria bacterium]|nr:hypothetical protein [Candidatus Limnocylindria bacterium]